MEAIIIYSICKPVASTMGIGSI